MARKTYVIHSHIFIYSKLRVCIKVVGLKFSSIERIVQQKQYCQFRFRHFTLAAGVPKVLSFGIIMVGIRADTETCNPLVFPAATDQGGGKKASTVLLLRRVDETARWHLMRRSGQ